MKRLVKARIRAGNTVVGEDQLIYPDVWNPKEIDMHGGCGMLNGELDVCMTGDIGRGGAEQWIVLALPEEIALRYAEDPDVAIIASPEADTIMEGARVGNNVPLHRILEPDLVRDIRDKQKIDRNVILTTEELDILNPDHKTKGINKTRRPAKEVMPDIDDDLTSVPANKKEIQRR